MEIGKWEFRRDAQGAFEGFVGFSRKPHHEIGSQPYVRNYFHSSLDQTDILFHVVRAIHGR